ncbi:MAG: hypothetical protein IKU60_02545 [Clostridia bacterium]|nr:hypothetical protein [Clostridia bacterium]
MLTNEYLERIKNETAEYMQAYYRGEKTAEQIANEIYEKEVSEVGAELITKEIKDDIEIYHRALAQAMEDKEGFIRKGLEKEIEDKSAAEKCKIYHRYLTFAVATGMKGESEREAFIKANESFSVSEEEAVKLAPVLHNKVVEALNSPDFLSDSMSNALNEFMARYPDAKVVRPELGEKTADEKLIYSMWIYAKHCNGEVDELDDQTAMREIVESVCASFDTAAVALQVENNEIEEDAAREIIGAILAVIGMMIFTYACVIGILSIINLIAVGLPAILNIIFAVLMAYVVFEIIFDEDILAAVFEHFYKAGTAIYDVEKYTVTELVKGVIAVFSWGKKAFEKVKSTIINFFKGGPAGATAGGILPGVIKVHAEEAEAVEDVVYDIPDETIDI